MKYQDSKKRLKISYQNLLKAAGGIDGAEMASRVSRTVHSRYGSLSSENDALYAPIDVVCDLEEAVQDHEQGPFVIGELCRQRGGVFVALPDYIPEYSQTAKLFGDTSKEFGDVAQKVGLGFQDDGKLSRDEIIEYALIKEVDDLIERALQLREAMKSEIQK